MQTSVCGIAGLFERRLHMCGIVGYLGPGEAVDIVMAGLRGCSIDHPRNLAKSVTVE